MTSLALPITHADVVNLLLEKAQATTAWSDKQAASMLVLLADILGDIGEADSTATILAAREAFINIALSGEIFCPSVNSPITPRVVSALIKGTNLYLAPDKTCVS